jgi:hypothetical protein
MRKFEPNYRVSGDGIHPDANGHIAIALEILWEWNAPSAVIEIAIDTRKDPPADPGLKIKTAGKSSVSFSFSLPLPMPVDPAWNPKAREVEKFDERVNRYSLKIVGPEGFLAIRQGNLKDGADRTTPIAADVLAKGVDLAELLKLSTDKKPSQVLKLIQEKNRIMGQAWVTHVGHKRPDTPKGMPFEEAKKKAAALDEEIRKLCKPKEISMDVGPFGT